MSPDVKSQADAYIAGQIDFDQFNGWLAEMMFLYVTDLSSDDQAALLKFENVVAEFTGGYISEDDLKRELLL